MTKVRVLDSFCGYVQKNWNASLGWGDDKVLLKHALEDYDWLLDALEITAEEFIDYFQRWQSNP